MKGRKMGKRYGRKKTRKYNEQQSQDTPSNSSYIFCLWNNQQISKDVCLVRQMRKPSECEGCSNYKGGVA